MKNELCLIVHNVRSAYNIGSIFRTADGAGVKKIYLSGYSPSPYDFRKDRYETKVHRQISKTALGAEKSISWEHYKNIGAVFFGLRKNNFRIYALEKTSSSKNIFFFKPKLPCALVLGNEIRGLDKRILDKCDIAISIPMRGSKESLNVSVAAGVAMYTMLAGGQRLIR